MQAEEIIDTQVGHFLDWWRVQGGVAVIRDLRSHAEKVRDEVLERTLRELAHGHTPEEALRHLAHALTNKLMHEPTVALREASADGRHELALATRRLFDLHHD